LPRQANGNYLPPANTAAVSNTSISSAAFNTLENDIGTEITNSVDRQGRSAMQADLPMGGFKATGLATPVASTDATNKAYVDGVVAAFFSTGDIKPTLKTIADAGWVLFDDGTIGSPSSGASTRANNDTQPLFTIIFNGISDSNAAILTSGGGATTRAAQTNAATAWAANCRISLPKALGRALAVAGAGAGLGITYSLGQAFGEFNHTLTSIELPANIPNTPTGLGATNLVTGGTIGSTSSTSISNAGGALTVLFGPSAIAVSTSFSGSITINSSGGSAHNNTQPTVWFNCMVKL
jgi:hypothetical protein